MLSTLPGLFVKIQNALNLKSMKFIQNVIRKVIMNITVRPFIFIVQDNSLDFAKLVQRKKIKFEYESFYYVS